MLTITNKITKQLMEILNSIVLSLEGKSSPSEYTKDTILLGFNIQGGQWEFAEELEIPETEILRATKYFMEEIRNHGYCLFARIPLPFATEISIFEHDSVSGVGVRFVRIFNPVEMRFVNLLSIGVNVPD